MQTGHTLVVTNLSESKLPYTLFKAIPMEPLDYYSLMRALFGYGQDHANYNWALLRAAADHLSQQEHVLCADPIQLRIDVAHVYSLGHADFQLTIDVAQQYINYLNDHLPPGIVLRVGQDPLQWYLFSKQHYQVTVVDPSQVVGKTLLDKMPEGPDRRVVLSLFNDIQMLLYNSNLNNQRRLMGLPSVDALWLWGSGRKIEPSSTCRWTHVFSDDDIVLELAVVNHVKSYRLSDNESMITQLCKKNEPVLVVDQRNHYASSSPWIKHMHEIYTDHGKKYVQKNKWIRLCQGILLI